MTSLHKGFITAGASHGLLLTSWLGYELTGQIYRESLRLDFTLSLGGKTSAVPEATSQGAAATSDDGEKLPDAPAERNPGGPAGSPGHETGGGYAEQNMSSISGMIHGRVYYPRIARRNNWQGRVLVHFVVGTDGKTSDITVRESSGHSVLDESAIETIRDLEGLPRPLLPVPLTVPVHFRLR